MSERRSSRIAINLRVIAIQDGLEIPGTVRNLSGGGIQMDLEAISSSAIRSSPLELEISGIGRFPAQIVWRAANSLGAEFRISDSMRQLVELRIAALVRELAKDSPGTSTETPTQTELPRSSQDVSDPVDPPPIATAEEPAYLRRSQRVSVKVAARCLQDGYVIPCEILDISEGGARLRFDSLGIAGIRDAPLNLQIPGYGQYLAEFRWRHGFDAGAEFQLTDRQKELLSRRIGKALRDGALPA